MNVLFCPLDGTPPHASFALRLGHDLRRWTLLYAQCTANAYGCAAQITVQQIACDRCAPQEAQTDA